SNTWRISTSVWSNGARLSHSIASSFDFTCHSQKPAISSFASVKGPSVTMRFAPENLTRAPFELGWSPSPASSTPAFASSSLNFPISVSSFVSGRTPASEFLSALTSTMNRIVVSPSGFGLRGGLSRTVSIGVEPSLCKERRTRVRPIDTPSGGFSGGAPKCLGCYAGLCPPHGVEAPRPGACGREVEPEEAVERRGTAAVHRRPETLREMELEVRHRHFARQEEGDRSSEQAEEEQAPAQHLEDAAEPHLGYPRDGASVRGDPGREGEELHRAGQHEYERGDDAENALQLRRPRRPLHDDARRAHAAPT